MPRLFDLYRLKRVNSEINIGPIFDKSKADPKRKKKAGLEQISEGDSSDSDDTSSSDESKTWDSKMESSTHVEIKRPNSYSKAERNRGTMHTNRASSKDVRK